MPKLKLKTHRGSKKVFTKRKNDVKMGHQGRNHNTGKKNTSFNRNGRKVATLSKADANRLKKVQF